MENRVPDTVEAGAGLRMGFPTADFWTEYADLWENSMPRSPFQSPEILKYFSSLAGDAVAVYRWEKHGILMGACIMRVEKGVCGFLSDYKTDHNLFVVREGMTGEDFREFVGGLLSMVRSRRWCLELNYQPSWAWYAQIQKDVLRETPGFSVCFPQSVSPTLEARTPDELFAAVNQRSSFRRSRRHLSKLGDLFLEVLDGSSGTQDWLADFVDTHIRRWSETATPSVYAVNPERREFLSNCVEAWERDGVLRLFSVRAGDRRIAFSINLLDHDSLVGHQMAWDPEFKKWSPGKALLHFVAEWMRNEGMSCLDFGYGDEQYKFQVTNAERTVTRQFIGPWIRPDFILKSGAKMAVRSSRVVSGFCEQHLKLSLRTGR